MVKTKVFIAPLGLFARPSWQDSIKAFSDLGVGKVSLLWNWPKISNVINNYKKGNFKTKVFINQLKDIFPGLKGTPDKFIINAWDKSCGYSEATTVNFDTLQALEAKGDQGDSVGRTNHLHMRYIKRQYGNRRPGEMFLSYDQKKLGANLTASLVEQIKEKYPDIQQAEIVHLRSAPSAKPYTNLWYGFGWVRWFLASFQMLAYKAQKGAFETIEKQKETLGFSTLDWSVDKTLAEVLQPEQLAEDFKASSPQDILDIEELGNVFSISRSVSGHKKSEEKETKDFDCQKTCSEKCKQKLK